MRKADATPHLDSAPDARARRQRLYHACVLAWVSSLALLAPIPGWSKALKMKWKPIPGAKKYEILIQLDGKTVEKDLLSSPNWKGELPSGLYTYQIRGIDRLKRPGAWNSAKPLFIAPPSPVAQAPGGRSELTLYDPQGKIRLEWTAPPELKTSNPALRKPVSYEISIRDRRAGTARTETIPADRTSLELPGLTQGSYTYQVRPIYRYKPAPGSRMPASAANHDFKGDFSAPVEFAIKQEKLKAPEPQSPLGKQSLPENRLVEFKWSTVPGALAYQVEIQESHPENRGSTPPRAFRAIDNRIAIAVSQLGKLTWKVRALASVEKTPRSSAMGPQSRAEVELETVRGFDETSGYVALSGMWAPYSYKFNNTSTTAGVPTSMATGRASGEFYFNSKWGLGGGVDLTAFQLSACSSCAPLTSFRKGIDLMAKRQVPLPGLLNTWVFAPKFGIEWRGLSKIYYDNVNLQLSETSFALLGPAIGFDLRKPVSSRLSLGIKVSWFVPLSLSGLSGASLSPLGATNVSVGAQAFYWIKSRWAAGIGVYRDWRGVTYTEAGASNTINMDSTNFFGSVIYSFGK